MAISERLFPKLDENGQEKAKDYMELLLQSGLYSQKNSIIYQFPRRTLKLYDLPVSAGTGQFLDSDSFSEMEVGNEVSAQADFGVRVSGDSMEPTVQFLALRSIDSWIFLSFSVSRLDTASSKTKIGESFSSALAIAIRCL